MTAMAKSAITTHPSLPSVPATEPMIGTEIQGMNPDATPKAESNSRMMRCSTIPYSQIASRFVNDVELDVSREFCVP
jgi:hypothetical protein